MTLTLNQDQSGDIDLTAVDGLESVRQRIHQRLLMQRGEYYLDTRAGVPYVSDILRYNYDENLARRVIEEAILSVQDVDTVYNIQIDFNSSTRRLTFSCNVRTDFGETVLASTIG